LVWKIQLRAEVHERIDASALGLLHSLQQGLPELKSGEASAADALDPLEVVMRYHDETKHHFSRSARSLGYMDWANQPDPFRRYEGSPLIRLPVLGPDDAPFSPFHDDMYRPGAIASAPVTIRALSRFLEFPLAISAWKQAGEVRWAVRTNPSSGNLHPTEGYLVLDAAEVVASDPDAEVFAPNPGHPRCISRVAG
jgi:hypothetical protein